MNRALAPVLPAGAADHSVDHKGGCTEPLQASDGRTHPAGRHRSLLPSSGRIVSLVLAMMWLWMGVVSHIIFFSRINKAAYLFGVLFVAAGLIFLWAGVVKNRLSFRWQPGYPGQTGALFILYAMVLYPLLGSFSGHRWPRNPVFGVAPCPVTIFTFGLLLWAESKVPISILVIPFLWSLVGGSAAWNLGVPEDYGLLVAGVVGTVLVFLGNRRRPRTLKIPKFQAGSVPPALCRCHYVASPWVTVDRRMRTFGIINGSPRPFAPRDLTRPRRRRSANFTIRP